MVGGGGGFGRPESWIGDLAFWEKKTCACKVENWEKMHKMHAR